MVLSDQYRYRTLLCDADGLGAGVRGDLRIVNDRRGVGPRAQSYRIARRQLAFVYLSNCETSRANRGTLCYASRSGQTVMHKKTLAHVGIILAVAAVVLIGTWSVALRDMRRQEIEDTLQPIAALLADNHRIIDSIKKDGYVESESAILSTYLNRIRNDGVPKNSDLKRRIDAIVNNDTMIVALLSRYAPHARNPAFRVAATEFLSYASSFRDRWQSVFEIFMAGGSLPAAGPVLPRDFADALSAETR